MKNMKISFLVIIMMVFGISASAQQDARRVKAKPSKTVEVRKGPFHSDVQTTEKKASVRKGDTKPNIWEVIPADGFVPTGDKDLDKKKKMEIQIRWAKENPKRFQELLELHGIKKPKKGKD